MTNHEYQEMLRAALSAVPLRYSVFDPVYSERHDKDYSYAQAIRDALTTPPPTNKLRSMSEAPRDGRWFVVYRDFNDLRIPTAVRFWPDSNRFGTLGGDTHSFRFATGWTELPEVSE